MVVPFFPLGESSVVKLSTGIVVCLHHTTSHPYRQQGLPLT
jgi:hypothetical protein